MIIDSHAHFWRETSAPHKNIGAHHEPIPVEEFIRHMDEAGVDKLIQLTHGTMGFDNSYSLEGATRYPDRIRVMGRLNAKAPDVLEQIRSWLDNPYMVGLRLMTISEAEAPWWEDGTMERLWPEIERRRIPVTLGAPERSKMIGDIAARYPGIPFIVDHAGLRVFNIFESRPTLDDWPNLLNLRRYPGVYVKVSALPEAMIEPPPFKKARMLFRELYDWFGPERLIWGSNYPRTTQICSYRECLECVRDAPFLSSQDRNQILAGNIAKVLNLPWR